ncbi:ninein [Rhinophrynus dorsalis]
MDEAEQDQYEARLKELFDSFDSTGTGSLGQEELTDLCHMLQLAEVAPSLQHALLQDNSHGRIHFDQFKEALILVLSSTLSNEESFQEPERTKVRLHEQMAQYRELWKNEEGEEYEAEGQLRFWNPDDLSASQNVLSPDQEWVEEKLQLVCEDLGITRDGHLNRKKLISICEQYGLRNFDKEALEDVFQNLDQEDTMSLQDFFYEVCKNSKPLTPSSSTPYRQLKRHLSMQSYDESGRRTITPLTMTGTLGFCLLSKLDDGTGYGSVEDIIDLWQEEGLENSQAILKALDFNLEGKINLTELTMTLENELLMTKNEVYQAALVSFRSEIRHLLERADQAGREKEKLRSDLEKNEKLKSQMASEVDDHHAAIERRNEYNLRKLDEEYKERTTTLKSELRKEKDQILQQASKQRLELEQELDKVKVEENFLRERLTLCLKESSRMETELLETSEKLIEYETLANKLQRSLDSILKEKFGDLDPSCAEFFRQEERLAQLRAEHERQRRELQDRIDELQLELEDYRAQGVRGFRSSLLKNSLSDEMDNKNAVEYDQGIGCEDCAPLNMSIEAEMAIEQMREQHHKEVEQLTMELESQITHYEEQLKEFKCLCDEEQAVLKEQFAEETLKSEEQIRLLKLQQEELEGVIVKLKGEQQKAECEHSEEMGRREAAFSEQKEQLLQQEAALLLQLSQAKISHQQEKEDLLQRAGEAQNELEAKVAAITRTFEEEKDQLERGFNEQISRLTERWECEKEEMRIQLLEEHQNDLQEQRWKKMDTECNIRISEMEAQFSKEYETTTKNHEKALKEVEEKFQNNLRELMDRHSEEKSQWEFEKEELIQENVEAQDRLKDALEKEKSVVCSELLREKDLLEKTYKELINNLSAEKELVQKELENLTLSGKKEVAALSGRIIQLENDLQEELTERDEQLCEAEKNIQVLKETVEKLEREYNSEREHLSSKVLQSEALYKEACEQAEKKKEDMFLEISRLQSTIIELQNEISSFSKIEGDYKLIERENLELKNVVSHLQNSSDLEEQRAVLKSLQNVHEQTVKENVRLVSAISRLRKKVDCKIGKGGLAEPLTEREVEENQNNLMLDEGEGSSNADIEVISQYLETVEDMHLRLHSKTKELEDATEALCKLRKNYEDIKAENGHFRNQMLPLQEKIGQLSLEYELLKKATDIEDFISQDLEETAVTIPGLKMLLAVSKKENLHLQEKVKFMELKNQEAVENNRELSSEVLWLQTEIQNMEEMAEASLKLEHMYEDSKNENDQLKVLLPMLQEKIIELQGKQVVRSECADKEIQTGDIHCEIHRLEPDTDNTEEDSHRFMTDQDQKWNMENVHLLKNVNELNATCDQFVQQNYELLEDIATMHRQARKEEEDALKSRAVPQAKAHAKDLVSKGKPQELSPRHKSLQVDKEQKTAGSGLQNKHSELLKKMEHLRCENKKLKEENVALKAEMAVLEDDGEIATQKIKELQEACEEMWVNLEMVRKEKGTVHQLAESLTKQVSELKVRKQQLDSENAELSLKNAKNQTDLQELNRRLASFLRQKDRKEAALGMDEWQRERGRMKEELEGYRSKVADSEKELSKVKAHSRLLEQENTLLKQEMDTKQLSKCSEMSDLKKEICGLINKNEKLLKEKETLEEELNRCVEKSAKVGHLENKLASMKQEQKSWDQQSQSLKTQLSVSQEKIQSLEENLQSVNVQMSRIKSDLRVAQQEKEALKQEVMTLHKQLQSSNAKNQVLEMAMNSSGLQNQQKKLYWDDLEKLMEQEQKLLRQENERLLKEVQCAKSDLAQSREKVRQLESTVISIKQQKHQNQSSMVKALEQEKTSLRRECDQLQKELISANRKISQMSSLERDLETIKRENEVLRTKQGKYDDQVMEMLHSASSVTLSHSQLQQPACATVPREQYLQLQQQLQQADRRNQQLQAAVDSRASDTNSPQSDQEQLLRKMEGRMTEVEQKLRIVKMLLQEKVNQLKEQITRNTKADVMIKDLYVENSQLLKALEMSEQRKQTAEKKNYLLEEKISGLSKIVRDLAPSALNAAHPPQRKS